MAVQEFGAGQRLVPAPQIVVLAAARQEFAQLGNVASAVREREIAVGDDRCVAPLERRVEAGGDQVIVDRVEARRALGMARPHVVAAAVGMAVEGRRHRSFGCKNF